MNYLHSYHAGNHTEVFKHSALVRLIMRLKLKPKPIVVVDTHAGAGLYDLKGDEAQRTREAEEGVLRVLNEPFDAVRPYIELIRARNSTEVQAYPGSPMLARALLGPDDRLIACELRDSEYQKLSRHFRGDRQASVHHRDGYGAMRALLPPSERRGIVFIDPPFENKSEMMDLATALIDAITKWPTGVFAAWYPIKSKFAGRPLISALLGANVQKVLSTEFLPFPEDNERLAGSGLVICNTPWQFDVDMRAICTELQRAFGNNGRWSVETCST